MQRAGVSPSHSSTALDAPQSIAGEVADSDRLRTSEAGVGEVRHDLHEQHEAWLIEQYLEGRG